ncbi:hypothetical protein L226DRAFT_572343 [Lentinus tigrinus ALCF2SS1-7]|uniref:F-box domain-containing protein n=1 Tax=Lentinus tigrinus ALCF2SS1-6 TaxID=1328759 RepID=A0A5C2S5S6_9APHY|nr:hypothetical protein L227DRAFT_612433 [Lentinus tigrinus ALCF2SS1-6]RPD73263.1 hypothetical protein L226DRAFT_572343 [Lentinus tigrinus ALCF2SS1-7]
MDACEFAKDLCHHAAEDDSDQQWSNRSATANPAVASTSKPTTSIHDLPLELLIHIFRFVEPTCRGDIRLSHVCRRWRAAIHGTPEFWRDLLAVKRVLMTTRRDEHQTLWIDVLERVHQLPLHLTLSHNNLDVLETPFLAPYLPRLSVLSVEWEGFPDLEPEFQQRMLALGPLPSLETLRCIFEDDIVSYHRSVPDQATSTAAYADRYPKLRYLEVNVNFLAFRMIVPSLKTLILHKGHISLSQLLAAMQQCPLLEYLELAGLIDTDQHTSDDPTVPTVHFPHLREWEMYDDSWSPWDSNFPILLKHILCPPMARMTLWLHSYTPLSRVFLPDHAGSHIGALSAVLDAVTTFDLAFTLGQDGGPAGLLLKWFASGERTPRLFVSLPSREWAADLRPTSPLPYPRLSEIASVLSSQSHRAITELHVDLAHIPTLACMRRVEWTILFDLFPGLVALTTRLRSCVGLLRALRQAPPRRTSLRLERLAVTCADMKRVHHGLVVTLEMRAARGLRLRHLRFAHSNEDAPPLSEWHLARLKDVVAEVVA